MTSTVNQTIHELLDLAQVQYRVVQHPPTNTSEESARARGEDLRIGGKALVIKVAEHFRLLVLSAALRIDSAAVKRYFCVSKIRFASKEELESLTGLVPGAVPPFGHPVLPLDLYADSSLRFNHAIAFNAGSLTESIILGMEEYLRLARPTFFSFAAID